MSAQSAGAAPASHSSPSSRPGPSHGSAHRIPFTAAVVTAQDNGSYKITWKAPGVRHVAVHANGRIVATGGSTGSVTVKGLPATADRQWFDLVPDQGDKLHLADRLVKLDGMDNFRDVGGYRTADGQWVKMGVVYRSGALNNLTDADLAKLKRLGISVDYDLRMTSERTAGPDRLPSGVRYVVANVTGDSSSTDLPTTVAGAEQLMIDGEKSMVGSTTAKDAYSRVFSGIIADTDGSLYHCSAGKDRTGWASAALLTALGVPRDTVYTDYLASNTYRAASNAAALAAMPAAQAAVYKPLLDVRSQYLDAGFKEVQDTYGSFTSYEKKALGLDAKDINELKSELLTN
ncbi:MULTISPECIES: tyrosine-protein phosphatase [unclassified Streptomyces]|uniref:tyrosine-protein phosphatase n=1 Tax=unclassified Streptomyces TaxID=2593676 RepID=UPI00210DCBEB|nr:tyrosine-protein phosphatase [Streptomyces sp. DvalAA-14]